MFEGLSGYLFAALILLVIALQLAQLLKNRKAAKKLELLTRKHSRDLDLQASALSSIFDSIPDLVFCKDLDLRFTRCNKNFEEYFNCRAEDLIGKDDSEGLGIPFAEAEQFRAMDRRVIQHRETITVEETITSAFGISRLFETKKTPLVNDGQLIGIMGISRDITQRKAAEETLQLTLDNLDTCIYINEIDTGEILFINERMESEFGGHDFTGKVCWKVLQNGFTEQCDFCPIPKLLESGEEYYIWEEHNTVTDRYYRNADSLIKWQDGRLVHMQHSVDITDAIKLQQDLEHASKAKSDFLSRMSHEIRTPLNAIVGMTSIASNTNDLGKIKHCLSRMENASKHLLGIINDILDMSKIEADKFELSLSEFDFERMLMNITNIINFRVEEKQQELVVNLKRGIPEYVIGDELRLSQVITNLLINAVKFTPEGGRVVLGVEMLSRDPEGNLVLRFEIVDTGIGISKEQQQKLFTSFEQADGSISRKFGGTGLGLAISKRIVELMGGTIWIESELGLGAKFIFTINAKEGEQISISRLSSKINRNNIRILAVDDSSETRDYFSFLMEAHKLPYDVAGSGSQALQLVEQSGDKPYNIFFVDWQMPEMDGIELTKRIKGMTGDNSVVIMISVNDWSSIKDDALEAGVSQFVAKPLFPSTLLSAINECIGVEVERGPHPVRDSNYIGRRVFNNHKILIAEDVEVNREIMVAVLEETGLSIDFAENGVIAVSMFEQAPDKYSLIFMDIQMPEMDGYEATRIIRGLDFKQAGEVPIIAMTANVFREDIENCLAAGMNDHLGKPVEQDMLFAMLDRYLPDCTMVGTANQNWINQQES